MTMSGNAGLARRGIKISHLRLFAALEQTGQMSAAAEALAISQPAASRLAAEAAHVTGATLYARTSRGVELTAAGQAFARRARRLLIELDETERELEEITGGMTGRVNIGSVTGPSVEHVLPAVRRARLDMPRVTVNIEVATSDVLGAGLVQGGLDFFLGRLPAGHDKRLFDASFIGPEPISMLVRAGHPLLRLASVPLERLPDFDWVLPFEGTLLRATVESALVARGMRLPGKVLNTSSFMLTVMTVSRTNAIAPVSTAVARFFASQFGSPSTVVELETELELEVEAYALIRLAGRELPPAAEAMYRIVAAEIARGRSPETPHG